MNSFGETPPRNVNPFSIATHCCWSLIYIQVNSFHIPFYLSIDVLDSIDVDGLPTISKNQFGEFPLVLAIFLSGDTTSSTLPDFSLAP